MDISLQKDNSQLIKNKNFCPYKPAWLGRFVQITAAASHETAPRRSIFEGDFRIKASIAGIVPSACINMQRHA
jgi:hypothetical protein